jgi:excinuclease ABC subunit C
LASQLDGISGVGPVRRKALIKTFGDLEGIRKASLKELANIPGITLKSAEHIQEALTG